MNTTERLTQSESAELSRAILKLAESSRVFREYCGGLLTKAIIKAHKKPYICQNEAFRRFGRANVERWKSFGLITPLKRGERKVEYNLNTLIKIATKEI